MSISPDLLERVGRALFGENYVRPLARALKDMNPRNVERWLAGEKIIPESLAPELLALIDAQREDFARALGLAGGSQSTGNAPPVAPETRGKSAT